AGQRGKAWRSGALLAWQQDTEPLARGECCAGRAPGSSTSRSGVPLGRCWGCGVGAGCRSGWAGGSTGSCPCGGAEEAGGQAEQADGESGGGGDGADEQGAAGVAEFAADLGGAHGLAEAAGWGGGGQGGEPERGDDAGA